MGLLQRLSAAALVASVAGAWPAAPPVAAAAAQPAGQFVLSPEDNHLWAYDAATRQHQLVVRAQNGGDPGASAPNGIVRDVNGQVCVSPDQAHVVTGEDTVVPATGGAGSGEGATSHDPRIAGWAWYTIAGEELGEITVDQVGKLAPEAGRGPGYAGDPDNFGCGFLDGDRLFTTAIGNPFPGEPANGQLFLWFGPFERGFQRETDADTGIGFFVGEVDHCEIDDTLATAGGLAVDANGDVYVATNRPTEIPGGDPGAIWRYRGRWPTTFEECTPEYLAANIVKQRVVPIVEGLPSDPTSPTPSAVVVSPAGTLYVSSVFSGTVSEYTKQGVWVRDLFPASPVAPRTGPTTQTPFGMAITSDGALWIADLGIAVAAPAPGEGSVIRLGFDADGNPEPTYSTVRDGLTFPDGLGVYTPGWAATSPAGAAGAPASQETGRPGAASAPLPATGGAAPFGVAVALLVVGMGLTARRLHARAAR